MTDKEIIKALECCIKDDCDNCPNSFGNCYSNLAGYALDLIKRQQAEIERLNGEKENLRCVIDDLCNNTEYAKSEAVKEFAQRVKNTFYYHFDELIPSIMADEIDNIIKEMVGEADDQTFLRLLWERDRFRKNDTFSY